MRGNRRKINTGGLLTHHPPSGQFYEARPPGGPGSQKLAQTSGGSISLGAWRHRADLNDRPCSHKDCDRSAQGDVAEDPWPSTGVQGRLPGGGVIRVPRELALQQEGTRKGEKEGLIAWAGSLEQTGVGRRQEGWLGRHQRSEDPSWGPSGAGPASAAHSPAGNCGSRRGPTRRGAAGSRGPARPVGPA